MERLNEALENEDFLYFLGNTSDYTNGQTRYEYLTELLGSLAACPPHHKSGISAKIRRYFDYLYLVVFPKIPSSFFPSR
jgi:hypothetical protein